MSKDLFTVPDTASVTVTLIGVGCVAEAGTVPESVMVAPEEEFAVSQLGRVGKIQLGVPVPPVALS